VINHTKDIACDIKPKVNKYIEKHSQQDCFKYNENLEINEDEVYEKVMLEIEEDKKIKSTWAKAFAQSQGDENKAKALYINLRVDECKKHIIKKVTSPLVQKHNIDNKQESEIEKLLQKKNKNQLTTFEKARLDYLIDYNKRTLNNSLSTSTLEVCKIPIFKS